MPLFLAVILVAFALITAWRIDSKGLADAGSRILAFLVIFFASLYFVVYILPAVIRSVASSENQWGEIGTEVQGSMPFINPGGGNQWADPDVPPTPVYGPVPTAAPTYVVAQIPEMVPEVVIDNPNPPPTPAPTPTPDPAIARQQAEVELRTNLYGQLETARLNGDRVTGKTIVNSVLAEWPEDPVALQAQADISDAEARMAALNRLHSTTRETVGEVMPTMVGLSFRITDDGAETLRTKWGETSTLMVISDGWLKGFTFVLPRGALSQFGVDSTGDVFSVNP